MLSEAKQISRKHLLAAQTKFWKEMLDTFFDMFMQPANFKL